MGRNDLSSGSYELRQVETSDLIGRIFCPIPSHSELCVEKFEKLTFGIVRNRHSIIHD